METSNSADSLSEWELLHFQNPPHHRFPLFPPSTSQRFQSPPPHSRIPSQPSSPVTDSADGQDGLPSDSGPEEGNEIVKRLKLRLESFKVGIVWIANRALGSGALWSFASVSLTVAAAVLLYWRLRKWRQGIREESENRLICVIKEKDQKINQLLLHMEQMNEMLTARRKVPVIRVG